MPHDGDTVVVVGLVLLFFVVFPSATPPATIETGVLRLGVSVMHLKVKDPMSRAAPSLAVLPFYTYIALL